MLRMIKLKAVGRLLVLAPLFASACDNLAMLERECGGSSLKDCVQQSPGGAKGGGGQGGQASVVQEPVGSTGYKVRVWATGTANYSHPDSIEWDHASRVWVGYQNVTAKDGTDHKQSTVVEYDLDGQALRTFMIAGHCDGVRIDPRTHLVWASSNEDGNPGLASIDPVGGVVTTYVLSTTVTEVVSMTWALSTAECSSALRIRH